MSKKHDILELNVNLERMSETLRKLRESKGLTQPELGVLIGYDKATISSCENGHTLPKTDVLIRLSDYYDVSIDYLLGRSKYRHKELEDIGKPLGLTDKSVNALLFLNANDYKGMLTKEFKDVLKRVTTDEEGERDCLTLSDTLEYKANLEIINLMLEDVYEDIKESAKLDFHQVLNNMFVTMYQYLYYDGFIKIDDDSTGVNTVAFKTVPKSNTDYNILFDSGHFIRGDKASKYYRYSMIEEIVKKLDVFKERISKRHKEDDTKKGGVKDGKHKTKRK